MRLHVDFETRSRLSLKKVGPQRYCEDPSTDLICLAWAIDDGPVEVTADFKSSRWCLPAEVQGVLRNPESIIVGHNVAEFDRYLIKRCGYGLPLHRFSDTTVRAAAVGLPRSLEDLAIALGLGEKDMEGNRIMLKMSRPRRPSRDNLEEFWDEKTKPEDYAKTLSYCCQDVEVERAADKILPELTESEARIWQMTVGMNDRGFKIDVPSVLKARAIVERESAILENEFVRLVGFKPKSPKAPKALGMSNFQKPTVRDALKRNDLTPLQRRALEIRQQVGRSSVSKLEAFQMRVQADGRLRNSLKYGGAERTTRWSGAGLQPQNFVRGTLGESIDLYFEALKNDTIHLLGGDVLGLISEMLRGFIVGPFCVGDFAQIEARSLAWFAGQDDLTELFRNGGDPYCAMATDIYRRPITKADKFERFIGKETVLGAGYQLGWKKFMHHLLLKADVKIEEEFAQTVIKTFRNKYQKVVEFWDLVERGLRHAIVNKSKKIKVGPHLHMGLKMVGGHEVAYIELPSGRHIHYWHPEVSTQDGTISYLGRSEHTSGWGRVHTYGGKIAENIVQAFTRDLLGASMVRLEDADFLLDLTVHDEVISEDDETRLGVFHKLMSVVPEWAAGLPLKVETFWCRRYRK